MRTRLQEEELPVQSFQVGVRERASIQVHLLSLQGKAKDPLHHARHGQT